MSNTSPRTPAVGFIFVTMLLSVMGFGLLIPVLPSLVKEFEGNNVTASAQTYGFLVAVFSLMNFIGSPLLGVLSDRFGRRPIILIATAGAAIDYVIMALAPNLAWLAIARVISGLTGGVAATANAYIADVTTPEKRAQAFGLMGGAFGLGFVVGPVIGGMLGSLDLRLPFWFAAGCSALNWMWGCFVLPESLKPENRRAFEWRRANPVGALLALKRFPAVLGLTESYFAWMMAQSMVQATWVLYTGHRYHWGTFDAGLSLMVAGVLMALVQAVLVKRFVPKLGETRAVIVGFTISIVAHVCYGFAASGWVIYAIMAWASLSWIAGPALQSYITKHVPANEQGSVQGIFIALGSLAMIPGAPLGTSAFGWAVQPEHEVHLPAFLSALEPGVNWFMRHLVPHHPGVAFFLAGLVVLIALLLAMRSFRRDTRAAAGVVAAA